MSAIISPYLGALVDDFVVLGVETGQMLEALTSSPPPPPPSPRLGCSFWGHREKLLWFLPWSLCVQFGGEKPSMLGLWGLLGPSSVYDGHPAAFVWTLGLLCAVGSRDEPISWAPAQPSLIHSGLGSPLVSSSIALSFLLADI